MQPGPDFNPYAAPSEQVDRQFHADYQAGVGPLATLGQRWWGAFLDNLLAGLFLLPGAGIGFAINPDGDLAAVLMMLGLVPYFGIQAWLIASTGQSLAKKLIKTRIVTMNGDAPGFVRGVLLRSWLVGAMAFIPMVGSVIGLVDALMIFRSDRRMLHDHIAGTSVIQVL